MGRLVVKEPPNKREPATASTDGLLTAADFRKLALLSEEQIEALAALADAYLAEHEEP